MSIIPGLIGGPSGPAISGSVGIGSQSLLQLRTRAQQRCDMVGGSFIPTAEWNSYINASCQALYDKLIEAYGNDYFVAAAYSITTDGTNDAYALPADFYKMLGVDLQISNAGGGSTGWITLRRFNMADRNKFTLPNVQSVWGLTNLMYRIRGQNVWFIPIPSGKMSLRLWYIPRFTPLVNDGDQVDFINGWEEWIVNDSAIKALVKEESDISGVAALQAKEEERLVSVTQNRDAGSPQTMVDVYDINGDMSSGEWTP